MKTRKIKTVNITDIVVDESLNPRNVLFWQYVYDYRLKKEAGEEFPPITVGRDKGVWLLIDGRQRLEADRQLKRTQVDCFVFTGPRDDFFLEAVRLNTEHGHPLSIQEIAKAAGRLLYDEKRALIEVAHVLRLRPQRLKEFVRKHIVWKDVERKKLGYIVPKKPLRFAAQQASVEELTVLDQAQSSYYGADALRLVEQVTEMLTLGALDRDDAHADNAVNSLLASAQNWLARTKAA